MLRHYAEQEVESPLLEYNNVENINLQQYASGHTNNFWPLNIAASNIQQQKIDNNKEITP